MTAFITAASILLLLVLGWLITPMLRSQRQPPSKPTTGSDALGILREQKIELDAERAEGSLSEEAYAQSIQELERRVLAEAPQEQALTSAPARSSKAWIIAVVIFLPLAANVLYFKLGNPNGLDPAKTAAAEAPQQVTMEQINGMVSKLAEKVKAEPNNVEALQMLARSYMMLERYPEAAKTYEQLATKTPNDAQVYADWADAQASLQNGSFDGKPEALIAQALKLNPNHFKALALAGTIAFQREDFTKAIADWKKARAHAPDDDQTRQSLDDILAEAENRLKTANAPKTATSPDKASTTLQLRGRITLADTLKDKVAPNDVLYVFARPVGGGIPLASLRYKAKDLPVDFDFSATAMMLGQSSIPDKLIVGARISKSGDAMAHAGDLQGFSPEVSAQNQNITFSINETVR